MDALSFELIGPDGRAVRAPDEWTMLLADRSRRRGRWREVVRSGDVGSFLTTILGAGPRALEEDLRLERRSGVGGDMERDMEEEEGEAGWMEEETEERGFEEADFDIRKW